MSGILFLEEEKFNKCFACQEIDGWVISYSFTNFSELNFIKGYD